MYDTADAPTILSATILGGVVVSIAWALTLYHCVQIRRDVELASQGLVQQQTVSGPIWVTPEAYLPRVIDEQE